MKSRMRGGGKGVGRHYLGPSRQLPEVLGRKNLLACYLRTIVVNCFSFSALVPLSRLPYLLVLFSFKVKSLQ